MLFQEEKERKPLGALLLWGLMVMRQGPLGLRAEILGIHVHMGWRVAGVWGWFQSASALI